MERKRQFRCSLLPLLALALCACSASGQTDPQLLDAQAITKRDAAAQPDIDETHLDAGLFDATLPIDAGVALDLAAPSDSSPVVDATVDAAIALDASQPDLSTTKPDSGAPTPDMGPPPLVVISEYLADPSAVGDTVGEWIELFNSSGGAVDLNGFTLRDRGSDSHTIASSVVIPPGGYLVLGRDADVRQNGGVRVDYVYSGFVLGNSGDEIELRDPSGAVIDSIRYSKTVAGKSQQRKVYADPTSWCESTNMWSGSTGDRGTPGAPTDC
ncbi:MAG: lamin tail domain-containing protein [Deltaproteobacteria bacterium]|nr:lamin tail domain-containing protein [Deltaproteobacteria bacterium]